MMHDLDILATYACKEILDSDGNHRDGVSHVTCKVQDGGIAPTFGVLLNRYVVYSAPNYIAVIKPFQSSTVPTGLSFNIPRGYVLYVSESLREETIIKRGSFIGTVVDMHVTIKNISDTQTILIGPNSPLCDFIIMAPADVPVYLAENV